MTPRYLELLEALKAEYENMHQEVSLNKLHRDDVEYKSTTLRGLLRANSLLVHSQLIDIATLQKNFYELERGALRAKQHYEEELARLKHEVEERGGSPHLTGTSAAAMIQFPTPPSLEQELQGFVSGFTNLPTAHGMGEAGAGSGTYMKRPLDEDPSSYGRSVRPRDEHIPRQGVPTMMPSGRPIPPAESTLPPAAMVKKGGEGGPAGSGFDWLVVYNPKASRSITIDLLHTFGHENVVCCVRFSQDGKFLATGSNRVAAIYNVRSGERVAALTDIDGVAQDGDQYIRSVSFSPDGSLLVTGCEDQMVRVWDIARQKLLCKLSGHSQDIYSVEFMPNDRNKVVSGSGDRTIRIWDIEEEKCIHCFTIDNVEAGKEAGITSVSVSPNGKYVAAGSLDRTIRLWSVESGKPLETLEGHRDSVYSVSFAPDGRHLISGSLDKTIKVWQFDSADEIHRGTCKYTILGHKDFVLSVAGTPPDGRWIVSGSKDRSVQFWDSQSGTTQLMLQGHKNSVISVAISPSGTYFATGSGDCRARIWSYSNMESPEGNRSSTSLTTSSSSASSGSLKTNNDKSTSE